jgi:rhodanese-related sulfurtransferase
MTLQEMRMFKSLRNDSRNRPWNLSLRVISVAVASISVVAGAMADTGSTGQPAQQEATVPLPAEKQTTLGLYVTAREAYARWQAAPDKVKIIDVRTPEEYLWVGNAPMAWVIPLLAVTYEWDEKTKQFPARPLPDFVDRVRKVASPQDVLLVMCRSGGRGAVAVNLLAQAGFKQVYNITDGMEGDSVDDPESVFQGQRLVNGWKNSGLPWTYKVDPTRLVLPPGR